MWTGSFLDQQSGRGTLRLEIPPTTGSLVTGTWTASFGTPTPDAVTSGSFQGVFRLEPVFFFLDCRRRPGGLVAFNGLFDPDRLHGTYIAVNCPAFDSGSFELARTASPSLEQVR
ncbi:MAG TPA: hypothetical protein VNI83_02745 [Vicinamibacterales bacterium]|nr:hypothetical protein [Vicinamibacterales bacterium]